MKTETIEDAVATKAKVEGDGNNPCLDEVEKEGENALRSLEASLEAVKKLSSMLNSAKKLLNDEQSLRIEVKYW